MPGKSWFTGVLPEFWLFALGGLFVFVTLFMPKGVVGLWEKYLPRRSKEKRVDPEPDLARSSGGGVMSSAATLLYLDGVSVSFDGFRAINNLSLALGQGRNARHYRAERRG